MHLDFIYVSSLFRANQAFRPSRIGELVPNLSISHCTGQVRTQIALATSREGGVHTAFQSGFDWRPLLSF